jgi:hypothetical protein
MIGPSCHVEFLNDTKIKEFADAYQRKIDTRSGSDFGKWFVRNKLKYLNGNPFSTLHCFFELL